MSSASAGLTLTIDTAAPAVPSTPDLTAGSDSGVSNTDNVTANNTPTFAGTAAVGSTVRLFADGAEVGSAVADVLGQFSITSSALGEGAHDMTATATDASGNVSTTSPFFELSGTVAPLNLPAQIVEGTGQTGQATVSVTNNGNAAVVAGQCVDIAIAAQPVGAADDSQDVDLSTLANQSIGGLGVGQTANLTGSFTFSDELGGGEYNLVALIDSADEVDEADESNNTAVSEQAFTVDGQFIDLSVQITNSSLPAATISGDGTKMNITAAVTNNGNVSAAKGQEIDRFVFARPADAVDDSQDVLVTTQEGNSISNLAVGATKSFKVNVVLPAGLASDQYVLVTNAVMIESGGGPGGGPDADNNDANNSAVAGGSPINVAVGAIDLEAAITRNDLPSAVVTGQSDTGQVHVTVTNVGNVTVDKGQTVDIRIVARPVGAIDDSTDIELATIEDKSISNLRPDRSKRFTQKVSLLQPATGQVALPQVLTEGEYEIVAIVDPDGEVAEVNTANNTVVSEQTTTVSDEFIDPQGEFEVDLPDAVLFGASVKGKATLKVTNRGNINVVKGQTVNLRVVARPVGAADDSNDVELANLTNQSISNLRTDKSKTFRPKLTLPFSLQKDECNYLAFIDSGALESLDDQANNTVTADLTTVVADPFVDLQAQIINPKLPTTAEAGQKKIRLPLTITNFGNTALATRQKIDVQVFARPLGALDDSQDSLLLLNAGASVSRLRAGASKNINLNVPIPLTLSAGQYVLVVKIDTGNSVFESDEDNNTALTLDQDAILVG